MRCKCCGILVIAEREICEPCVNFNTLHNKLRQRKINGVLKGSLLRQFKSFMKNLVI